MKRIFTILFSLIAVYTQAQVTIARPERTSRTGTPQQVVQDRYLRAVRSMWIPFTNSTTPTLNSAPDSAGNGLQLLSNGRIAAALGGGLFSQFYTTTQTDGLISGLSTSYAPITGSANYIQNQSASDQTGTFRLTGSGKVSKIGLGAVPLVSVNFYNTATLTGGTNAFANFTTTTIQPDVTVAAYGNRITLATAASAFTLPDILYNEVRQGAFGAGSSVTNQYGFSVDASLIGATGLNVGYRGFIPAAANRYNLYMVGTAQNYLNGNLGIGVSAPLAYLHLKAGTTAANTAPIKLTSGSLMTTPESGSIEFLTDSVYVTQTTSSKRQSLAYKAYVDATYVPKTLTLSINGTTYGLSSNRTWSVGTVTSVVRGYGMSIQGAFSTSGTVAIDPAVIAPLASPAFTGTTKVTVVEYADNAAAVAGGLAVGSVYRTGDILKIVH